MKYKPYQWLIVAFVLLAMSYTPSVFAGESSGNVSVFFGSKALSANDWEPVENQSVVGIKFDMQVAEDSPISFAFDLLSSADTDSYLGWSVTGKTLEKNIGIRIRKKTEGVSFFSGLGISFIDSTFELGPVSASGSGTGLWFEVGVNLIKDDWVVGLDLISSSATTEILGVSADGGGLHLGIFIGTHW